MKIAFDISQIVYGTGASRYIRQLVEHLVKIDNKNQYILFGASLRQTSKFKKFEKDLEKYPNVQFKIVKLPPSLLEILWNRLHIFPIEIFIGEVDIFHSSDWLEPPVKSPSTKKVTIIHDMIVYLFPSALPKKIVTNQKNKLKWVKKESDLIFTNSETSRQDVIKFLGISPEKVKVISCAAAPCFSPQSEEVINKVLEKYNIKKPYILSVGTQEPRKNISLLLEVFEKIFQDRPKASLVLTGKYGWGKQINTGAKVISTGFVSEVELAALYSGSHVFVYPSLYEGFGLPILEAMACGVPVVTSNNSSMQEIAKDAAILVDPRNKVQLEKALKFVLDLNLDNYQKMVRASLDRARKYSWSKTAKETLQVFREITKSNPEME